MLALLDGDIIAFRAAAGADKTFQFDGETAVDANPELAAAAAVETVQAWAALSRCKDILVCFSGVTNFRRTVLPSYKAHRTKGKPPSYWTTVEAVNAQYPTRVVDGLEADDVMGILATTDRYVGKSIVVTLDKDLRGVPGVHFNPLKDTRPVKITEAQADYFWLTQVLTGDPTDGYKGLPGIGPAKAAKILGPTSSALADHYWPKVQAAYLRAGLSITDALTQARVARILRRCDYDKAAKEIILWHPSIPMRTRLSLASLVSTPPAASAESPPPPTT